tara:strand:+ start:827 stop:1735 length:909 start_codon:yes stop_codon:yes gene_type:complete
MPNYHCKWCNFSTELKSNYTRHLNTKKHKKCIQSYPKCYPKLSKESELLSSSSSSINKFICKYCGKSYKYRPGLSKHIKYTCKNNEDEDLKELVKLMNEQIKDINNKLNESNNENKKKDKMIKKLTTKLQINNYNTNNVIVTNILNYKDTDISHLTAKDYEKAIHRVNDAIPTIMKQIHFNPLKPENMNIYIPNIKDKYLLIFNENEWQIESRSATVNNLIDDKYLILKEWYDENLRDRDIHENMDQESYNFLKENFEKFDANIENEEIKNIIKEEIIMFLYNKRNMIIKNSQENFKEFLEY